MIKYIASLLITFSFVLIAAPAQAHRPFYFTQTKCMNHHCTIVKQRTCIRPTQETLTCTRWRIIFVHAKR